MDNDLDNDGVCMTGRYQSGSDYEPLNRFYKTHNIDPEDMSKETESKKSELISKELNRLFGKNVISQPCHLGLAEVIFKEEHKNRSFDVDQKGKLIFIPFKK